MNKLLKLMPIILAILFLVFYLTINNLLFIKYKFYNSNLSNETLIYQSKISGKLEINRKDIKPEQIPNDNTLMIPRIGVSSLILEARDIDVLNKSEGVWREPDSSTPDLAGNMVIAGHRWQFLPPNTHTFYLLPELIKGDYIIIYWRGKEHDYQVINAFETYPEDISIYKSTKGHILTLYTCSPLYIANKRFVIQAKEIYKLL